jgi:putative oxidoreductase|uniref:DoxX family protein n=1 Tax=uncultured marine thaumarchaeote AD1000_26_G12 TaxID=1455904 RepID=A0A075FMZ5_9ARCH|nr:DoxX family protein [uncultured marine thaumarchaeote AD1000_26_G12]|tara:strand:+ start:2868 stop:3284 length:417 start_codon:yes stop_codon:yes gene_type:complete
MQANLSTHGLHDAAQMGMRLAVGVIFIVHGFSKFGNPGFGGWISSMGIPAEMQIPIALAEFIPGILLLVGVLTRISASLISIVMLGAIFLVKGASSLTGEHGYELDLILLASCLVVIVAGPGRVSLSYALKKVPRILQ